MPRSKSKELVPVILVPKSEVDEILGGKAGKIRMRLPDTEGLAEKKGRKTDRRQAQQQAAHLTRIERPAEWNREIVERAWRESAENARRVLVVLANRAGEWVLASELAGAVGLSRRKLTGVLGAFSRRCKNRYELKTLPFSQGKSHEHRCHQYGMSGDVAEIIRELAGK